MLVPSRSPFLRPQPILFALASLALLFFLIQSPSIPTPWRGSSGEAVAVAVAVADGSRKCSPADWSAGTWRRKENPLEVTKSDDVYAASGFHGCASNREVGWHLSSDDPDYFPWRGNVSAYEWVPPRACDDMPRDFRELLVVDLVERGGWLLIGDSITEQHFFSISCTLYPHVLATPDYSINWDWDRAWPQHLHLNPESPLVSRINFPEGFNITQTPLVTFRRNDLLFNLTEIETMFNGGGWRPRPGENTTLFGTEPRWTISVAEYLNDLFFRPLPEANYHALIVNTASHWSLGLFSGLPHGFTDIIDLFRAIMNNFVYQAGRQLDLHQSDGRQREVVIRDYLTGNDNCHSDETMYGGPLKEVPNITTDETFWAWIPIMNRVVENAVVERAHPHVTYLPIDRPGRLRPEAHVLGDCLHLTVGAGVIEGWTQYLHYYLGTYLPWHRENPKP